MRAIWSWAEDGRSKVNVFFRVDATGANREIRYTKQQKKRKEKCINNFKYILFCHYTSTGTIIVYILSKSSPHPNITPRSCIRVRSSVWGWVWTLTLLSDQVLNTRAHSQMARVPLCVLLWSSWSSIAPRKQW